MNTERKTAIIVGAFFIPDPVAGILIAVFTGPVLNAPDYLISISANQT